MKLNVLKEIDTQPLSVVGLTPIERSLLVISSITDANGITHVISRFGDSVWNLSVQITNANVNDSSKLIVWPLDCPSLLIDDAKAVLYAWMKIGMPGIKPVKAGTAARKAVGSAIPFIRWLAVHRIDRFCDVKPLHISNYVHFCKTKAKLVNASSKLTSGGCYNRLQFVDLLWQLRSQTAYPLAEYPWGETSAPVVSGIRGNRSTGHAQRGMGKTKVIPRDIQVKLFLYCEKVLSNAEGLFAMRELGEILPSDSRLYEVRDACIYLICISSGMRNDEVCGIENGASRTSMLGTSTMHWIATEEHKTGKGRVEFLVPENTLGVLKILERFAAPLQKAILDELMQLEGTPQQSTDVSRLLSIEKLRQDSKRVVLTCSGRKGNSHALSGVGCGMALNRISRRSGARWYIATHQLRKTYARTVVESRMGRSSLLFLKWQFKHSGLSMTELYASNPLQDPSLFEEIQDELNAVKTDIIRPWLDGQQLSGGAGRKISQMRATPVKDLNSLLEHTVPQVHIRATGHAWCLAQERSCGGAGLYDAPRCEGCGDGVIDGTFASVWTGIYKQQVELIGLEDIGITAQKRARREANIALKVISELGVDLSNIDLI